MWYRFALTEIEPDTGQLVLPGMKSGKFDTDLLTFETVSFDENEYTIYAFVPASKSYAGILDFRYRESTNDIIISDIRVNDISFYFPNIRTHSLDHLIRLKDEDFEKFTVKNVGKGIATKLYKKMLEVIHDNPVLSKAKYIIGNTNSLQTAKSKERIFGKPELAGKGYVYQIIHDRWTDLENQKRILELKKLSASSEDKLLIDQKINEINELIEVIEEKLDESSINPDSIYDFLKPSDGRHLGSNLGGNPVDTYHKIPPKPDILIEPTKKTIENPTENPTQQRLII